MTTSDIFMGVLKNMSFDLSSVVRRLTYQCILFKLLK